MAKKKNSTALFEAISRSRDKKTQTGVETPGWMGTAPQSQENAGALNGPTASDSRGSLVLSGTGVVLILAAVLAVGAVAFLLGRSTGKNASANSANKGGGGSVVNSSGADNAGGGLTPLVAGKWYLIIDRMNAGRSIQEQRADAELIVSWLRDKKKVPCKTAEIYSRDGRVIGLCVRSLTGFDSIYKAKSAAASQELTDEAQKFAEQIEAMGKEFKKSPEYAKCKEKYTFSQHSKDKFDPSYRRFRSQPPSGG